VTGKAKNSAPAMNPAMNKDSRIYMAGHQGLVGSAILRRLEKGGYRNIVVRTRSELDLTRQEAVEGFFAKEKPEFVILAAARVGGVLANSTYPAEFIYENLAIETNIIHTSHLNGVRKLLFLGSSCIYPKDCPQPMKEEYFMEGKSEPTNEGYAIAKISGMKLCEKINEQFDKKFISCMPTNIYGEGDNFDEESSHVIPALIRRFHKAAGSGDKEVEIWGSGKIKREFMYVDDLADTVLWLMNHYDNKEFVNVGTGRDVSIKDLAYLIKKVTGYKGNLIFDTSKPDGMSRKLLNTSNKEIRMEN